MKSTLDSIRIPIPTDTAPEPDATQADHPSLARKLGAEAIGTFMLTLVAAGGSVVFAAAHAAGPGPAGPPPSA